MTKTNLLGFVASIPIPETIRNINAFTLGAKSVNKLITTKVVWVNEWFNPQQEKKAAEYLHKLHADILIQNTDSPAVLQYAQENNIFAIGNDSDMKAYGPKAHLGSAILNWGPYYAYVIDRVLKGTWKGGNNSWWGLKENAVDLVSISDKVPQFIIENINLKKRGIKENTLSIWRGPIIDNKNRLMLDINLIADDRYLAGMNFFVEGVDGKIPGKD
jgi:simple sugar transport system substrate-binding protein